MYIKTDRYGLINLKYCQGVEVYKVSDGYKLRAIPSADSKIYSKCFGTIAIFQDEADASYIASKIFEALASDDLGHSIRPIEKRGRTDRLVGHAGVDDGDDDAVAFESLAVECAGAGKQIAESVVVGVGGPRLGELFSTHDARRDVGAGHARG